MTHDQLLKIEAARRNEHLLTPWERDFTASLAKRPKDYDLTDKQAARLDQVAEKVLLIV